MQKNKRKRSYGRKPHSRRVPRDKRKRIGVMDLALIFVAILLIAFTVIMIVIFCIYGAIPDTLCACFFSVLGTECGAMAWIKTTKERHRERSFELQDRKYYDKKEAATMRGENQDTEV